jgi:hypothetical protein
VLFLLILGLSGLTIQSVDSFYNDPNTVLINSDSEDVENQDDEGDDGSTEDDEDSDGEANSNEANNEAGSAEGANGTSASNSRSGGSNSNSTTNRTQTITVNIFIDVTLLNRAGNRDRLRPELRRHVPANGLILAKTSVEVERGATAFDVLQAVTRANRIPMSFQGASANIYNSVYIQGINHIFEFDAGPRSGWMYSINGTFPNRGMSAVTVNNGDTIRMVYTLDLGCDLGQNQWGGC